MPALKITAKRATGFWRCGVFHPHTPTTHLDGVFTPEQVAILKAEPQLEVVQIAQPRSRGKAKIMLDDEPPTPEAA